LYKQSLSTCEQQLGADHPDTATSLNNLAGLYESQGRYSEAEPLYARAVEILLQTLGQNHPNTQTTINNFQGCVQQAIVAGQGDLLSAHPLTQAVLQQLQ
jgi:tetratricopeptide (TPR) repeat protein